MFQFHVPVLTCLMTLSLQALAYNSTGAKLVLYSATKSELVIEDRVQIEVKLSVNLTSPVSVQPNYEWNHPLLKCVNCDNQPLQYTTQSARFEWTCIQPGILTVFFTAHPADNGTSRNVESIQNIHSKRQSSVDDHLKIEDGFIELRIGRSHFLHTISWIFGWGYVISWSCALYPQLISNYCRKSVVGLNFDFIGLSLVSFSSYFIYNASFWIPLFRDSYRHLHPHSNIPVQINDVIFSLHNFLGLLVKIIQCCVYERGDQRISDRVRKILVSIYSSVLVLTVMLICDQLQPLAYIYFFSCIKVSLTIIKFIPQLLFNYRRKSTQGFTIETIIFDFIGSVLSVGQMTCLAINFADSSYFVYNVAKLGIALISQFFDLIFFIQHFWLYRPRSSLQS